MGGEVKTGASDEFQNLEVEMKLRHEGKNDMHALGALRLLAAY